MLKFTLAQIIGVKQHESEQYGRDVDAALAGCSMLRYLDLIPLPRTLILILAHFIVGRARANYSRSDEFGWGSATFSEINRDVSGLWSLYFVVDLTAYFLLKTWIF